MNKLFYFTWQVTLAGDGLCLLELLEMLELLLIVPELLLEPDLVFSFSCFLSSLTLLVLLLLEPPELTLLLLPILLPLDYLEIILRF